MVRPMTNLTALIIAFVLVSLGIADVLFNEAAGLLFIGRKLLALIEYLAVWR